MILSKLNREILDLIDDIKHGEAWHQGDFTFYRGYEDQQYQDPRISFWTASGFSKFRMYKPNEREFRSFREKHAVWKAYQDWRKRNTPPKKTMYDYIAEVIAP